MVHQRSFTLNFTRKRVSVQNIVAMIDTGARLYVKFKVMFLWCCGITMGGKNGLNEGYNQSEKMKKNYVRMNLET